VLRVPAGIAVDVAVAALLAAASVAMRSRRRPAPLLLGETPVAARRHWPLPAPAVVACTALVAGAMGLPPPSAGFAAVLWLVANVATSHRAALSVPRSTTPSAGGGTEVRPELRRRAAVSFTTRCGLDVRNGPLAPTSLPRGTAEVPAERRTS